MIHKNVEEMNLEIIRIPEIMQETSKEYERIGKSIGFVPTMGALHKGHMSLIERARIENDITIVSIFVNPAQFGEGEDLNEYPRDIAGDIEKIEAAGADIIFMPEKSLIYPDGYSAYVKVKGLSDKLCGIFRPVHFEGVATIIVKLFNILSPKKAYFGQKDFQQSVIIKKITHDLNMDVEIILCSTIREEDGLAMSSRNLYLNIDERKDATLIYKSLKFMEQELKKGKINFKDVPERLKEFLNKGRLVKEIQYASIYDPISLDEIAEKSVDDYKNKSVLIAIAIKIGNARLIDNIIVTI